jgi:acyl-CoA thioester hydrolase
MSGEETPPAFGGRLDGGVHRLPVRVYYEDTDFSGVVYHAGYLRFMERGRTEFLRHLGVHHGELQEKGLGFVVRHMAIDFEAPARMDDLLIVETRAASVTGARLVLDQLVTRDGLPIASARVTVAVVTAAGRPVRLPKDLADRFAGVQKITSR